MAILQQFHTRSLRTLYDCIVYKYFSEILLENITQILLKIIISFIKKMEH